jgi:type VI secretion system protein ImpE
LSGDLDRADKQLDALSQLHPELALGVALARQLARAAVWRKQFFQDGRLPEFVDMPSPTFKRHLEATVHVRAGELRAAADILEQAQNERPHVTGTCDGAPLNDLRDLDDVLAPVLEIFTANGKYYWIGFEQLITLELQPPQRPRDLFWRPARIAVRNGPEGDVHLPVLYPGSEASDDDLIRMGRSTTWSGGENEPVRGLGQRMLLVGDEARPFLEITQLAITPQAGAS